MARDDWFRNTIWNAEVEAAFMQRLRRARDKFQPLRIQAHYLEDKYPKVALDLLEKYFALGEHFDNAAAHVGRAHALTALGETDKALMSYEAALERERQRPSVRTGAYLDFGYLVVKAGVESSYARALEVLESYKSEPAFPIERYLAHGIRAILLWHFGRRHEARSDAALALKAVKENHSGFRHHPNLGLVENVDDWFFKRVSELAR